MRILVADDEDTLRSVISDVLMSDGHEVTAVASAEEALDAFRRSPFPLVLTDIVMKRMTGLDLLAETKIINPACLVVVMTSHASLDSATTALRSGAYDYLTKPFEDLDAITAVVNRAIEKIRLVEANEALLDDLKNKTEELEQLNASLRDMANKDGLTGLFNHRYFREALDRELARARRHGHPFSVLLLDIDHFKLFNDSFGHLAGDEALRKVAVTLRATCRASSVLARYGGEEFVVMVPETDKQGIVVMAERVRQAIADARFTGAQPQVSVPLTVSCGVATFGEDGCDSTALLGAADEALYRAKGEGRNRTCAAPGDLAVPPAND